MILLINTTNRNKIEIGLLKNNKPNWFEFPTKKQSEEILPIISGILKKEKLALKDIDAIFVHEGPGSYTGLRIGIVTANTLAWTLNKPVISFNDKNLSEVIKRIPWKIFHHFVLPSYKSDPFSQKKLMLY